MFYLFDNKQKLTESIPNSQVAYAYKISELYGTHTIEIEFKNNVYKQLSENTSYIGFVDESELKGDKFQLYKILNNGIEKNSKIVAIHIFYDDLKSNSYIREKRPNNQPLSVALATIFKGTNWNYETHISRRGSANWYDIDRLEAFKQMLENWNVEADFDIRFNGREITKKTVHIYDRLGVDTGKRVVYGHNSYDMKVLEDKSQIYTALAGRGKGEEKTDEDGESTGGYGRKIQFTDVVWSKSKGDPVDKPKGQDWVEIPEATRQFGYKDGTPRMRIIEFSDCEDPEELLSLTYSALKTVSRPLVSISTSIEKIGNVSLGDTVNIIRKDLNIYYKARVIKINRNLLSTQIADVEIGDFIKSSAEKQREEIRKKYNNMQFAMDRFAEKVEKDLNEQEINLLKELQDGLANSMHDDNAYNYNLKLGNEYNLPAGFYSFDKPINENPRKVIYFGAGKLAIANSKDSQGKWRWSTFGTGDGFVADNIVAGKLMGGNVEFDLTNGTFEIGGKYNDSPLMSYDGKTLYFGKYSDKEITVNNNGDVKLPEVDEDDIAPFAITETKINNGAITTPKIQTNAIISNHIRAGSINADHIETGAITTDFLYPGSNERIILEKGYGPGSNNVKSIDANGDYIRLKYNGKNYLRIGASTSLFYIGGLPVAEFGVKGVQSRNGVYSSLESLNNYLRVESSLSMNVSGVGQTMYLDSSGNMRLRGGLEQWSDISLKSNIKYLDSNDVIKKRNKEEFPLTVSDCTNFIKKCKTATYFYEPLEKSNLGIIAQDVKKFSNISKYMITTDKKDNKLRINTFPYMTVLHTALQEEIKRNDELEKKNRELEKRIEKIERIVCERSI